MIDFLRNSKAHLFEDELKDNVSIVGGSHHHLARVKRLAKGDLITIANKGFVREYSIVEITRDEIQVEATGKEAQIIEPEINIVVSLFKLDRLESGISKAIEAGATSISIGTTERSSLKIEATKQNKILQRCESIALSAAMQSRRSSLVPIAFVGDVISYCENIATPIVVCEPFGSNRIPKLPVTVVIGPEGGFSPEELIKFECFSSLWSISPYILRAETAMAVVPALLNISTSDAK